MDDDLHHVTFRDAEVGNLTSIVVNTGQAEAILAARAGVVVPLNPWQWIRLQPESPGSGERVYHYHHGGTGEYGYVQARERDLRAGLERALHGGDAEV
jgi:hypothetical protein